MKNPAKKKSKLLTENPRIIALELGGLILHDAYEALCHIAEAHLGQYLSPTKKEVELGQLVHDAVRMATTRFYENCDRLDAPKKTKKKIR